MGLAGHGQVKEQGFGGVEAGQRLTREANLGLSQEREFNVSGHRLASLWFHLHGLV